MAIHEKIKYNRGGEVIHFLGAGQKDYSLCGCDLAGDSLDGGYDESKKTNEKVNCKDCIRIVELCKKIKRSEWI